MAVLTIHRTDMTHNGIILSIAPHSVKVQITVVSACASCAAHSKCGFAESKDKIFDIPIDNPDDYTIGQPVLVKISEERGLLATWWAYLLPALLLVAVAIGTSAAGLSEPIVILLTFLSLGLYLLLLLFLRKHLNSQFSLSLSPLGSNHNDQL